MTWIGRRREAAKKLSKQSRDVDALLDQRIRELEQANNGIFRAVESLTAARAKGDSGRAE